MRTWLIHSLSYATCKLQFAFSFTKMQDIYLLFCIITVSYSLCLKIWVVHAIRPKFQLMQFQLVKSPLHRQNELGEQDLALWGNRASQARFVRGRAANRKCLGRSRIRKGNTSTSIIVNSCHKFCGFDCINFVKVLKIQVVSRGYNRRVQDGDPTAHAEMVCFRNAGRRTDWHRLVLVSTLRFWNWPKRITFSKKNWMMWAHILQSVWDVYWNIHSLQSAAHYRGGELELQGQPFSI